MHQVEHTEEHCLLEHLTFQDFQDDAGDGAVSTLADARRYIEAGPAAGHRRHGFGLCAVELKASAVVIGLCGLLRRDTHPDVEIGFALLPRFRHQGYALEAAQAALRLGTQVLGLGRIVAITSPGNSASIDRKSTRLNSSHSQISYAVFCLKKKKQETTY